MNGTVIFGVAMIIVALFTQGWWFFPLLVGGVAVAAFGAFAPAKPARRGSVTENDDAFV